MKSVVVILLMISATFKVSANCGEKKTALFFANGMFNDRVGASGGLWALSKEFGQKFPNDKIDVLAIAFNTDEKALLQLNQVFEQKTKDLGVSFWKSVTKFLSMPDENIKKIIQIYLSEQKARDKDLSIQISSYENFLKQGFKIITVSHSQGNFYTNFSFESLNTDQTQMISVATPASSVYGDGPYFTFKTDAVIAYIPGALPPNRTKTSPGIADHEFIKHYLFDEPARNEILSAINLAYAQQAAEAQSLNPKDAYFNSDMNGVLKWFVKHLEKKSKFSNSECLAAEALFSVFALHGRNCEKRDFATFAEAISDCKTSSSEGETACPYYRGMDLGRPYEAYYPSEVSEHLSISPNCKITTYKEFKEQMGSADLLASIKLLESLKEK